MNPGSGLSCCMPRIRGVLFSFEDTLLEPDTDPAAALLRPTALPGAGEMLATCFGRYRLGLVCAGEETSAATARAALAAMDWTGWFESVAAAADLGYGAADPNLFRAVASTMGILPGMIAAICTSDAMSAAANGAGCRSIRMVGPPPGVAGTDGRAWTVNRLTDIPRILGRLENAA